MSELIKIAQPPIRAIAPEIIVYESNISYDVSSYFLNGSIENSIESGMGTASLTFAPVNNSKFHISTQRLLHILKETIRVHSLISIKVDRNSIEYDFFGLINHVYEQNSTDTENTGRTLGINCSLILPTLLSRDSLPQSGILFNDPRIIEAFGEARTQFFKHLRGLTESGGNVFTGGSPKEAILYILQNTSSFADFENYISLKKDSPLYGLEDTVTYEKIIDIETLTTDMMFNPSLSTYSGSVLDYVRACIDLDFYEMFFETATYWDGGNEYKPTNRLVIRPKPYTNKAFDTGTAHENRNWKYWEDLPTLQFYAKYKVSESIGVNDFELKNFFSTNYENNIFFDNTGFMGAKFPVIDIASAKRYGMREMHTTVKLLDSTTMEKINKDGTFQQMEAVDLGENFFEDFTKKRDRIVEWYLYPEYESGQLTVIGNSQYKIGRRLRYEDRPYFDRMETDTAKQIKSGMDYYITGVTRNFGSEGEDRTTINVIRGQHIEDGYIKKWYDENLAKLYKRPVTMEESKAIEEKPLIAVPQE